MTTSADDVGTGVSASPIRSLAAFAGRVGYFAVRSAFIPVLLETVALLVLGVWR
jgi:hypothetical protein